jgi:GTP-binding protein LepA
VGDTITLAQRPAAEPLPGYLKAKPMVFAGIYPVEGEDYQDLKEALEKLQLNDASLVYEPETSQALNFGFRCGFLGLFHMEIIQERLEREYDLDMIFTAPSVEYEVTKTDGTEIVVDSPADLPEPNYITEIREPWVRIEVFTPTEFIGAVMDMVTTRRGEFVSQEYLDQRRVLLAYKVPLTEILTEFYNELKARTRGYAPGLPLRRVPAGRHGQAGRAGQRAAGGRAERHRPSRRRLPQGAAAGQQDEGTHPQADVRGADPGGDWE